MALDATHDPALKSWVESANQPDCDFPIQNLPFGIFKRKGAKESPRGGVAIGDQILDLAALDIKTGPTLNGIASLGRPAWKRFAQRSFPGALAGKAKQAILKHLVPMKQARALPAARGRRLHRLLQRHPPRHQHRANPAAGQSAAAELQVGADRLSRPQLVHRGVRDAGAAPARPDQGARRIRSRVRSEQTAGLRSRAWLRGRAGQRARQADRRRQSAGSRVRRGAGERLVGARHPGLGVPAARAVPRQELRHDRLAVDRHAARRSSLTAAPRSRAPTAIRSRCPTCGTTPTSAKADLPSTWRCTCAPKA